MTESKKNDANEQQGSWLRKSGQWVWKLFKWSLIIAVPLGAFTFAAWWSLLGALNTDVQAVPDVRGRTVEEAQFALSSRSLRAEESEEIRFSQEIDQGLVLQTDPPAGSQIKRGRTVRLILSAGFERKLVPDLVMKSIREAELLGRQNEFRLGNVNRVYSDLVPVGRIIAQNPEVGTAFISETVDVLVSKGPVPHLMLIPNMVGRPVLPVLSELRERGIPVKVFPRGESRDISNSDPFELRQLYIYRQWPSAGSFVDTSSPETIILRVDWR